MFVIHPPVSQEVGELFFIVLLETLEHTLWMHCFQAWSNVGVTIVLHGVIVIWNAVSTLQVAQCMRVNIYKVATKSAVFIREKVITDEVSILLFDKAKKTTSDHFSSPY